MGGSRSSVHVLDELPQPREDVDAENQAESAAPQQARSSVEMSYVVFTLLNVEQEHNTVYLSPRFI
jgi:hypothetical protein